MFLFHSFRLDNGCCHHWKQTSSIVLFASVNQSVTLGCGGAGVSFWGLQCDYVLLSLLMIDVSHRNTVKIISKIY